MSIPIQPTHPFLRQTLPCHISLIRWGGGGENSTPPIKVYPVFRWRCVVPLFVMAHFVLNPFQKAVKELTKEIVDGVGDSLVSEVQWSSVHYTCIQRLPSNFRVIFVASVCLFNQQCFCWVSHFRNATQLSCFFRFSEFTNLLSCEVLRT